MNQHDHSTNRTSENEEEASSIIPPSDLVRLQREQQKQQQQQPEDKRGSGCVMKTVQLSRGLMSHQDHHCRQARSTDATAVEFSNRDDNHRDLVALKEQMEWERATAAGVRVEPQRKKRDICSIAAPEGDGTTTARQQQQQPVSHHLPGAFREAGIKHRSSSMSDVASLGMDVEEQGVVDDNSSVRPSNNATAVADMNQQDETAISYCDLVKAQLVRESQIFSKRDLEVAEPMEESSHHRKNNLQPIHEGSKRPHRWTIGGLFILLVLIALLVVLVTTCSLGANGDNLLPTTPEPSAAPTLEGQELLLSLLPKATQNVILSDDADMTTTPQAKAYQWIQNDPNFDSYTNARLVQRFALSTFFYATDGPNWKHKGGETVEVEVPGPPGDGPGEHPLGGPPPGSGGPPPLGAHGGQPPGGYLLPPPPTSGGGFGPPPPLPQALGPGGNFFVNVTKDAWLNYNSSHEYDWFLTSSETMCPSDNETVEVITMVNNKLAGSLPAELGLLSSLQSLELLTDSIGGRLPSEIGLLTNLKTLLLNNLKVHGGIPPQIGQLSNTLSRFSILDNNLKGSLPSQLWGLSLLTEFQIDRNKLSGYLPTDFGEHIQNISTMSFGDNLLTGSLPPSIGNLTGLTLLRAESNSLTGSLPTVLGWLENLRGMKLDGNSLNGKLPSEIGMLPNIRTIELGYNLELSGTIPWEWSHLNATLRELDLAGTSITGSIPPSLCHVGKLFFDCSPSLCGCNACPCV